MAMKDIFKGFVGIIIGIIGCALCLIALVLGLPIWALTKCGLAMIDCANELLDFDECEPVEENSEEVPT